MFPCHLNCGILFWKPPKTNDSWVVMVAFFAAGEISNIHVNGADKTTTNQSCLPDSLSFTNADGGGGGQERGVRGYHGHKVPLQK